MTAIGTKLVTLEKPVEVVTPGTAVQAPTTKENTVTAVICQAPATNEEPIVVGDKNVKFGSETHGAVTQRGVRLKKEQSITFEVNDTSEIWVDAKNAKDCVLLTALVI